MTTRMLKLVNEGDPDHYYKPVLTDEIIAIGRPDASLAKELGQDHVVAFIGLKNTYLIHKGGEELERISQLKLDGKRMDIDAGRSYNLYQKDKQLWGQVTLTYGSGGVVAAEEQAELQKAGFTTIKDSRNNIYIKIVGVEGVIYPSIKLSDEQMTKITTRRAFNLYNSRDSKPPMMGKILRTPLIAVGVAEDIVFLPMHAYLVVVMRASHY